MISMEYLLINRSSLQALCSSIGWKDADGHYEIYPNCLASLESIEQQLINENIVTRNIRLSLGLSRIIEKDLLSILTFNDLSTNPSIIRITVRLLVNLTLPPEVLLSPSTPVPGTFNSPIYSLKTTNESFSARLKQLQKILLDTKKAFIKSNKVTSALINIMRLTPLVEAKDSLQKAASNQNFVYSHHNKTKPLSLFQDSTSDLSDGTLDTIDKNLIHDCLLLFRNLLHVPDRIEPTEMETIVITKTASESGFSKTFVCSKDDWQDTQRRIIWNLLVQGLDNTLLFLLSTPHRRTWICHIVQLITLLYKNQPVSKLIQCISTKNSASDCSEDDVESDHTLSAQRSSSTSILSDSSSSKECGAQSSESKNDSGYYQQTEMGSNTDNCQTDYLPSKASSGIVKMDTDSTPESVLSSTLNRVDWQKKSESVEREVCYDMPSLEGERKEPTGSKEAHEDGKEEKEYAKMVNSQEIERMEEDSLTNDNQTSGFSGSSEEDYRRMHKVMKPHQRSTTKPTESDDSDDSDYDGGAKVLRCHPPNLTRKTKNISPIPRSPNCCPSICMETAIAAALSAISVSTGVVAGSAAHENYRGGNNHKSAFNHISKLTNPTKKSITSKSQFKDESCEHGKPSELTSQSVSFSKSTSNAETIISASNSEVTSPAPSNKISINQPVKPIAPWDKKKTCGSKSSSIGNESIAPNDNDICSLLKEFTLKFVHNFFSCLILDLSKELLLASASPHNGSPLTSPLDLSHLLWLISYFLKISSSIDLNYNHLSPILQIDMFGFLVYNGLILNEEIELLSTRTMGGLPTTTNAAFRSRSSSTSTKPPSQCQASTSAANTTVAESTQTPISPRSASPIQRASCSSSPTASTKETKINVNVLQNDLLQDDSIKKLTRKLQLLITALKEMIITVAGYIGKSSACEEEKQSLNNLRSSLAKMAPLRQFFLILTRCYSPVIHPKSFLVDSIITHHHLMVLLDEPFKRGHFNLVDHLQQFATIRVMEQYGHVLEAFQSNSELVNNCVFTLMHHVAGDLRNPECLFQPIILKTFSLIMESDMELQDSWEDLMEYVMNRFVKAATRSNANRLTKSIAPVHSSATSTLHPIPLPSSSGLLGSNESPNIPIRMDEEADGERRGDLGSIITSTHRTRDATICSSFKSCGSDISSSIDLTNLDTNHDQLYWLYLQYEQTSDPISCILEVIVEEQDITLDRSELISQLLIKGIISAEECNRFMEYDYGPVKKADAEEDIEEEEEPSSQHDLIHDEPHNHQCNHLSSSQMDTSTGTLNSNEYVSMVDNNDSSLHGASSSTPLVNETLIINVDPSTEEPVLCDETAQEVAKIDCLIEKLIKMGFSDQLSWIGSILLDIVNVKMCQVKDVKQDSQVLEPVAYFSNLLGQPVPIVPFNEKQELALNSKPMVELLQRIGFQLPNEISKLYPRIPIVLSPDIMFKIACKISSPQESSLLFKPEEILKTGKS